MHNTELLLIRACKSKNPQKRVVSVYKRFYSRQTDAHAYLFGILANICEKYELVTLGDMIETLHLIYKHQHEQERNIHNSSYHTFCMNLFIDKIRWTDIDKFPGYVAPRVFKEKTMETFSVLMSYNILLLLEKSAHKPKEFLVAIDKESLILDMFGNTITFSIDSKGLATLGFGGNTYKGVQFVDCTGKNKYEEMKKLMELNAE